MILHLLLCPLYILPLLHLAYQFHLHRNPPPPPPPPAPLYTSDDDEDPEQPPLLVDDADLDKFPQHLLAFYILIVNICIARIMLPNSWLAALVAAFMGSVAVLLMLTEEIGERIEAVWWGSLGENSRDLWGHVETNVEDGDVVAAENRLWKTIWKSWWAVWLMGARVGGDVCFWEGMRSVKKRVEDEKRWGEEGLEGWMGISASCWRVVVANVVVITAVGIGWKSGGTSGAEFAMGICTLVAAGILATTVAVWIAVLRMQGAFAVFRTEHDNHWSLLKVPLDHLVAKIDQEPLTVREQLPYIFISLAAMAFVGTRGLFNVVIGAGNIQSLPLTPDSAKLSTLLSAHPVFTLFALLLWEISPMYLFLYMYKLPYTLTSLFRQPDEAPVTVPGRRYVDEEPLHRVPTEKTPLVGGKAAAEGTESPKTIVTFYDAYATFDQSTPQIKRVHATSVNGKPYNPLETLEYGRNVWKKWDEEIGKMYAERMMALEEEQNEEDNDTDEETREPTMTIRVMPPRTLKSPVRPRSPTSGAHGPPSPLSARDSPRSTVRAASVIKPPRPPLRSPATAAEPAGGS